MVEKVLVNIVLTLDLCFYLNSYWFIHSTVFSYLSCALEMVSFMQCVSCIHAFRVRITFFCTWFCTVLILLLITQLSSDERLHRPSTGHVNSTSLGYIVIKHTYTQKTTGVGGTCKNHRDKGVWSQI